MLTMSICYGPDAVEFEALLVLLTLWFHLILQFELRLGFHFHHQFQGWYLYRDSYK